MNMANSALVQLELPFGVQSADPTRQVVLLDAQTVEYRLVRRRGRRRISLSIDERGLRVGAPLRASNREIESVLREHARWVLRKLAEWQSRRTPPLRWTEGEKLMLRGENIELRIDPRGIGVRVDSGCIRVAAAVPERIARNVTIWFRESALADFCERVRRFRPILEVKEPRVRLSSARTRWGSCHANGSILLNWRLIQMPPHLIDYVVVHELAHLREMNHSPRFWAIVGGVIPDYAARRAEIRGDCHRYLRV
jgi:predicted metal-dependent hydrolase